MAGIPRVISQEVELIPKATVTVVKRSWSMGHHFCLLQKDATSVALRLPKLQYFLGCVWFRVESSITGRKYRKVLYIYIISMYDLRLKNGDFPLPHLDYQRVPQTYIHQLEGLSTRQQSGQNQPPAHQNQR